ncbi:MAG: DNA cytosine methyltransferase [Cobetia sp.]|jgi:DNA (cytosine-5)-methyltransferase 1|uniref:DNA cytosine methyltransferase n=2 Tax=Cobetia TaxID=204286 RepID=UPI000C4F099D|nr:DNA cytosine methyltransferase [Cobetia sp.]MBF09970.1 DNA (cytosine-5-)-methyltransferase [Cobetia sp.]|tara:strand:- start:3189 stop:4103 length:915 start_codon:yes stop_codon:yes gene_type:complete
MNVIDLFAGAGGFSTGATMAGCNVAWAANHWPDAVEWHSRNHPNAAHICQDLHQADWSQVPAHDLMLASPCCQGHSKARGKASGNPQHDASRSTAWAVVSAAEYHRPPAILVENVPEFLDWQLYRPWVLAMQALGYAVSPHVVDAADLGAPQNRIRMFLVLTQSAQPLKLNLPTLDHLPAASFIDFEAGRWQPIEKPGRAAATLERVRAGRATHGDRFLISYYGNTKTGRSLDRPIGTITTRDRWAIVDGDRMRMLSRWECRSAMSFPDTYQLPDNHRLAVHLLGNAVCPTPVSHIIKALQQAA